MVGLAETIADERRCIAKGDLVGIPLRNDGESVCLCCGGTITDGAKNLKCYVPRRWLPTASILAVLSALTFQARWRVVDLGVALVLIHALPVLLTRGENFRLPLCRMCHKELRADIFWKHAELFGLLLGSIQAEMGRLSPSGLLNVVAALLSLVLVTGSLRRSSSKEVAFAGVDEHHLWLRNVKPATRERLGVGPAESRTKRLSSWFQRWTKRDDTTPGEPIPEIRVIE